MHTLKRTRSLVIATAVAVMASPMVAGCSTNQPGPDTTGDPGSGEVTTITFWNGFTGPDGDVLTARVNAFNESQSEYRVDMEIMPWDVLGQKLLPALGAGQGPNLSVGGIESVGQNATSGAFANIDEFYEQWDEAEQAALFPALLEGTKYDGHHFSAPMTFSPTLTFYNKALFTEAGLDPESPPVTWEEYRETAIALTKDENGDGQPEQYGFVTPDHIAPAIWEAFMWSNGGGSISADGKTSTIQDPKSIEAVTYWAELLQEHKTSPAGIIGPDAEALFTAGKVGMVVAGPWMINGFKEAGLDFAVTNVPKGAAGAFPVVNSNQFFISNDTLESDAEKAAVWAFLEYWNSHENQVAWSVGSGNPPTRHDITQDEVAENEYMAMFLPFQNEARVLLPNTTVFGDAIAIYENAMQKVTAKQGTPEEIMTAAGVEMQKLLDSQK